MSGHPGNGGLPSPFDPQALAFNPPSTQTPGAQKASSQRPVLTLQSPFGANDGSAADPRLLRSALTPYPSAAWSPNAVGLINSAGWPTKGSYHRGGSLPAPGHHHPTAPSSQIPSPLNGLGISAHDKNLVNEKNTQIFGAASSSRTSGVRHQQTGNYRASTNKGGFGYIQSEEYHNANNKGSFNHKGIHDFAQSEIYHKANKKEMYTSKDGVLMGANTDSILQYPFTFVGSNITSSSSAHSTTSNSRNMLDTPASTASLYGIRPSDESASDDHHSSMSYASNELDNRAHRQQTGGKAIVWAERPHPRSLRRALKDPRAEWEEAFPGALTTLSAVNPEHYQMPFGTRVINIKTDLPANVVLSIRLGRYAVMGQISERIMSLYNSRPTRSDKVLLLFSINGSKKFLGLAELTGAWDPRARLEGWQDYHTSGAKPSVGSFPVTWVYVKDVSIHHFAHIRQLHNGKGVSNMWNGMNFSPETGRQVIEQYVRTPAYSSILGHPTNYKENMEPLPPRASYPIPGRGGPGFGSGSGSSTGGSRGANGAPRGAKSFQMSWRNHEDDDPTPRATKSYGRRDMKIPTPTHLPVSPFHVTPGGMNHPLGAIGDPPRDQKTPTQRSAMHAGNLTDTAHTDQLKARYHRLQGEKATLQSQLKFPKTTVMSGRLVSAKLGRVTFEIEEIALELSEDDVNNPQEPSPERRSLKELFADSTILYPAGSSVSRGRADDGRPLYSASMLGTPHPGVSGAAASGGGTMFGWPEASSPWGPHGKAVENLVASPKDNKNSSAAQSTGGSRFFGRANTSDNDGSHETHDGAQSDQNDQDGGVSLH